MSNKVRVTAINHAAQDIACSPVKVYDEILAAFADGTRFAGQGYAVTPLRDCDLAAFRGGYRLTLKNGDGELLDDRICRITERDDEARRLSIRADYLMPTQMGLVVHVTYQAATTPTGARYLLDCHSDVDFDLPADDSSAKIEEIVAGFEKQSGDYLKVFLDKVKEMLEAEA